MGGVIFYRWLGSNSLQGFRQMPWPSRSLDSACDWFVSKALVVWGDIDLVSPHQEPWSFQKGEISLLVWILSWWMIHSSPRAIMDTEDGIPNLVTWDFWRHYWLWVVFLHWSSLDLRLSFYLYCLQLIATVPEEPQVTALACGGRVILLVVKHLVIM